MKKLLITLLFVSFGPSWFAHAAAPYDDAQSCIPASAKDDNSALQACTLNGTCCLNSTSKDRFANTKPQDLESKVAGILGTAQSNTSESTEETK